MWYDWQQEQKGKELREEKSGKILFQKYEIIRPLGQGTEGQVYLAKDLHLDRLAAVKESLEAAPDGLQNAGEVMILKELTHPGLPGIYDYFQEEGKSYLVMEYVAGISLREYLQKNKTVSLQQALHWAVSLCDIFIYLHNRGQAVIYRDLKPENIMVQPDGSLKLIDLGGAMRYACEVKGDGCAAGTPGYCPPEQWKEKKGDKTWDTYALCAVLHELLTGIYPGKQPFIRLPVRQYDRSMPRGLERVIERGTSEKKEERYQTMEQLKEALLSYGRTGWQRRISWQVKKILVGLLFLESALAFAIPLYQGVAESEIPFPFLSRPLFLAALALIFRNVWFSRRKSQNYLCRQTKNIWLTEKKFSGLYIILFFLLGSIWGGKMREKEWGKGNFSCSWAEKEVYAGENEEKLWVEMRDDLGRKMLLKDGATYIPEECVRFEIPADRLPDEKIRLQMVAEGENGDVYVSRVFLIAREKQTYGED